MTPGDEAQITGTDMVVTIVRFLRERPMMAQVETVDGERFVISRTLLNAT